MFSVFTRQIFHSLCTLTYLVFACILIFRPVACTYAVNSALLFFITLLLPARAHAGEGMGLWWINVRIQWSRCMLLQYVSLASLFKCIITWFIVLLNCIIWLSIYFICIAAPCVNSPKTVNTGLNHSFGLPAVLSAIPSQALNYSLTFSLWL